MANNDNNKESNKSQVLGIVAGLATAAALVAAGALIWKFVSDKKAQAEAKSGQDSTGTTD